MYRLTSAGTTTRSIKPATSGLTGRGVLSESVVVDSSSLAGHGWVVSVENESGGCFCDDTRAHLGLESPRAHPRDLLRPKSGSTILGIARRWRLTPVLVRRLWVAG